MIYVRSNMRFLKYHLISFPAFVPKMVKRGTIITVGSLSAKHGSCRKLLQQMKPAESFNYGAH